MINGKIETQLGDITIANDVIARIAAVVAGNCYGVVGMAYRSKADGFASILRGDTITRGVKISINDDNSLSVQLHIITQYGVNITAISQSIMNNVKYQIKNMTGFEVKAVNIHIESVRVNGK